MKHCFLSMVLALTTAPLIAATEKVVIERSEEFPDKTTIEAKVYRGGIVFNHYCALCHGPKADGNGRAAKIYNPRPANLVKTDKNDQYKELIIRRGGAALMRSPYMPPWGNELTDEQISDVIAFLRSVQEKTP